MRRLGLLIGIILSVVKGLLVLSLLYASIYALNINLQFVEPEYFDSSISFDIVRKCAEPLFDFWNDAKQALITPPTQTL